MGNKKKERKEVISTLRGKSTGFLYMDDWAYLVSCPICSEIDAFSYFISATKSIEGYWLCRICGSRNEPDLSDLPMGCLATGMKVDA